MINTKSLIAVLLLLTAVTTFFLLPGDEKKIRSNLSSLAEYCSTPQQEPVLEALKKASLTAKLCATPCKVTIDSLDLDRDLEQNEISQHLLMMKKQLPGTRFSFHDTTVQISGKQAAISTTLRLHGKNVNGRFTDAYEFDIKADKTDGKWLFSSFHVVEFMER